MSVGITLVGADPQMLGGFAITLAAADAAQADDVVVHVTISPLGPGQHGGETPLPTPTPADTGSPSGTPGQCVVGCAEAPTGALASTGGDPTTAFVWVSLALVAAGVLLLVRPLDARTAARMRESQGWTPTMGVTGHRATLCSSIRQPLPSSPFGPSARSDRRREPRKNDG